MFLRRVVLVAAGLVVAGLGVTFVVVGLDRAGKVAALVGAVVGVVGLGVTAWAALGGPGSTGLGGAMVRVRRTGSIRQRAMGGTNVANAGVVLRGGRASGTVDVARTGDIDQDGGGEANTGVRQQ
ncbi:MAG TPA: hypothetical protein VLJ59_04885 [Mycobacteriales bacterium]|nr:hypothetical protein [Mycobacteriales bacterium]